MILPVQNIKKYFTGFGFPGIAKQLVLGLCLGFAVTVLHHASALAGAEWCLHSAKVFLLLMLPWQQVGWWWAQVWERTQTVPLSLTGQRDVPYHMGCCVFVFPSHCCAWWSPVLLGMDEHLRAHGKREINSLLCFAFGHNFSLTS